MQQEMGDTSTGTGTSNSSTILVPASIVDPSSKTAFYVIRKCKNLHAPIILFTQEDCDWFLCQEKEGTDFEFDAFDFLIDASKYILDINLNVGAKLLSSVKKSAKTFLPPKTSEISINNNAKTDIATNVAEEQLRIANLPPGSISHTTPSEQDPFTGQLSLHVDAEIVTVPNSNKKKRKKSKPELSKRKKRAKTEAGDRQWNARYDELLTYYQSNGHCNVRDKENRKLYVWILKMREEYQKMKDGKKNILTKYRLALLMELSFNFHPNNNVRPKKSKTFWIEEWDTMLKLLLQFKEKFGTADVPNTGSDPEGFAGLGQWVGTVRQQVRFYKENSIASTFLNEEKIQALLNIGFCFEPTRGKKRCLADGLGSPRPASGLRNEDKNWLNSWDHRISMLSRYREKYGTADLPESNVDFEGFEDLKRWVTTVCYYIRQYNADPSRCPSLGKDKVDQILNLGMSLYTKKRDNGKRKSIDGDWDNMFAHLAQFHTENGHVKVPTTKKILNSWCTRMRLEYDKLMIGEKSILTAQRVVRMVELGFRFERTKRLTFDERVQQWKAYRDVHGKDPGKDNEDGIDKWITDIRYKYKQKLAGEDTNLTQEQIDRMASMGFCWESAYKAPLRRPPQTWDESFADLVAYKEKHGHVMVPRHDPELGRWVHWQRSGYMKFLAGRKSHLTTLKIKKLTELGFAFRTTRAQARRYNQVSSDEQSGQNNGEEEEEIPAESFDHDESTNFLVPIEQTQLA